MADYYPIFIILTLIVVIIIQAVERYFHGEQTQKEQSKLIAALLSRNIDDYTHAVRVEKEVKPPPFKESDEVPLSEASDDVFDKYIENEVA